MKYLFPSASEPFLSLSSDFIHLLYGIYSLLFVFLHDFPSSHIQASAGSGLSSEIHICHT